MCQQKTPGAVCETGKVCDANGACVMPCGQAGHECCKGPDGTFLNATCGPNLIGVKTGVSTPPECRACGGRNEFCCASGSNGGCRDSDVVCVSDGSGFGRCTTCGGLDGPAARVAYTTALSGAWCQPQEGRPLHSVWKCGGPMLPIPPGVCRWAHLHVQSRRPRPVRVTRAWPAMGDAEAVATQVRPRRPPVDVATCSRASFRSR